MAKLLQAKNPLTGNNMDLSIGGIVGMLLGTVLLIGVIATGQNVARTVGSKINNKFVDFEVDPIARAEVQKDPNSNIVYYG